MLVVDPATASASIAPDSDLTFPGLGGSGPSGPMPQISNVYPAVGKMSGNFNATVQGSLFGDPSAELSVTVGGRQALWVQRLSSSTIRITVPPGESSADYGPAQVVVIVNGVQSSNTSSSNQTIFYEPQCEPSTRLIKPQNVRAVPEPYLQPTRSNLHGLPCGCSMYLTEQSLRECYARGPRGPLAKAAQPDIPRYGSRF